MACLPLSSKAAVTLGQTEDFSGIHGWDSGSPNPFPPQVVPDSGPLGAGDSALRITSNGGTGPGGRLIVFNETLWTGDYPAAGILAIAADLRNGGSTPLSIRLAVNGAGGWFVTSVAPVAAFSGWVNQVFDLRPSALTSAGGLDAAATLSAVSELRVLHSAAVDFRGARVSSSLLLDNLRAVPEPSGVLIVALAGFGCFFRKR